VGSHQSRVEGQNPLPRPAGHAAFDAAQDTVHFLGCKCTFLGHAEHLINQHPQVFLNRAALNPFIPQPVSVLGIASTLVQNLHLTLLNFMRFAQAHLSSLVKVPLDGILSLQHIDHTTHLGVIVKLAEGAPNPTVHVTNEDAKQCRSQYQPQRNATRH